MKVTCDRKSLLNACRLVGQLATGRDVKPVLRNLKLSANEKGECTVAATDLEVGIRTEIAVKVDSPGEALLSPVFVDALAELSDEVVVDVDPDNVNLVAFSNVFEFPVESVSDFPDFPVFSAETYHSTKAKELKSAIQRTIFATASQGGINFSATVGMLVEAKGDKISLVATDGRRLAKYELAGEPVGGHEARDNTIVPKKAMSLVEESAEDDDDAVVLMACSAQDAVFKAGKSVIYTRLVEGRFPSYRQVVPSKFSFSAEIEAGKLKQAVRQAAVVTDQTTKRVDFTFGGKKLNLSASNTTGKSAINAELTSSSGTLTVSLDPKYVLDGLNKLDPKSTIKFSGNSSDKPILITWENFSYVIVPLVENK